MKRILKFILLFLLGIIILIQFIPSNRPLNEPDPAYDFFAAYDVPADIEEMVRASCFDCHSQEVKYPWYAWVAPVSWLVSRYVRDGRSHLDYSKWNELEKKDKIKMAGEIGEEVEMGEMPMPIYIIMHSNADLDQAKRERIMQWSEDLAEKIFEE